MTVDQQTAGDAFIAAIKAEVEQQVAAALADFTQPDVLLTAAQVAGRLGCTDRHVRNLMAKGQIAFVRVAGAVRIQASEIDRYIAANRVAARGEDV